MNITRHGKAVMSRRMATIVKNGGHTVRQTRSSDCLEIVVETKSVTLAQRRFAAEQLVAARRRLAVRVVIGIFPADGRRRRHR